VKSITKIVATIYGIWVCFWLAIAIYGALFTTHGEFGVSAHLWLILTGLPISLLSLEVPNGSVLGVLVAGIFGLLQWCVAAEVGSNWFTQRKSKNVKP
jgi:hypothetical protein